VWPFHCRRAGDAHRAEAQPSASRRGPAVGVFRPGKKPLSVSCLPDLRGEARARGPHHLCDGEVVGHEDAAEADLRWRSRRRPRIWAAPETSRPKSSSQRRTPSIGRLGRGAMATRWSWAAAEAPGAVGIPGRVDPDRPSISTTVALRWAPVELDATGPPRSKDAPVRVQRAGGILEHDLRLVTTVPGGSSVSGRRP